MKVQLLELICNWKSRRSTEKKAPGGSDIHRAWRRRKNDQQRSNQIGNGYGGNGDQNGWPMMMSPILINPKRSRRGTGSRSW